MVVSDDIVARLVLPRLEAALAHAKPPVSVIVPTGERHKTLASVELILRAAVDAQVDCQAVFVGIGGGVAERGPGGDETGSGVGSWRADGRRIRCVITGSVVGFSLLCSMTFPGDLRAASDLSLDVGQ